MIRVRIAPSPTGFAHIGTAYTALFNYAFARHNKGTFVIRVEDTDVKRNVKGAEEAIFGGLEWLGLDWDESVVTGGKHGPYRQSEKLDVYRNKAKELVKKGWAKKEEGAIRFNGGLYEKKINKWITWKDLIRGKISFHTNQLTDFVVLKSDGYPTYNFAVVIDDLDMEVTHVIRGEEHIPNTPRQIALYKVFGQTHPEFAHHVTLRGADRRKLSKRRDPVDLRIYREQGYLPEALLNFLCLLGWSHPQEKEIFSLAEFVKLFDLKRMRKAGPVFDVKKLDWMNGEYIRKTQNSKLKTQIYDFYDGEYDKEAIEKVLPLVQTRMNKLSEFGTMANFFFKELKIDKKLFEKDYKMYLKSALEVLEHVKPFNLDAVSKELMRAVKENKYKTGDFFMSLRLAIAGSRFTPPINESIVILGKNEVIKRLKEVLD